MYVLIFENLKRVVVLTVHCFHDIWNQFVAKFTLRENEELKEGIWFAQFIQLGNITIKYLYIENRFISN